MLTPETNTQNTIAVKQPPPIWVSGSDFVIGLSQFVPADGKIENPVLSVGCLDGENQVNRLVSCRVQHIEGQPCLTVAILALHIPLLDKVWLSVNGQTLALTECFSRYRLNRNKLNDTKYLSDTVFNAGVRALSGDELFIVSYVYLDAIPMDNPNYGGLITLLSYRITDQLDSRKHLLHKVYMTYLQYRETVERHDATAFRWFVSSSSTLATALLAAGNIQQAAEVVDWALAMIIHPSFNPMAHQNYSLLLFQAGLIKVWYSHYEEAANLFIATVNASRHGMIDLLHPKNEWILGQLSDCHKFLHIAEAAHRAAIACTGNKLPPPSRFAQLPPASKLALNFQILFDRFTCFKGSHLPAFFSQVLQTMQTCQETKNITAKLPD